MALTPLALCLILSGPARGEDLGFEERRLAYLESLSPEAKGAFGAVARLANGNEVDLEGLAADLEQVNRRQDCADFRMAGFLRLLYLDRAEGGLPPEVKAALEQATLGFKYWIDEPGHDGMCYWSENHQVLFHSAEYLAGALYPDRVFSNTGLSGAEHRDKGEALLRRWLSWRERFGFSEWLSNVYYEEDIYALLNLVDFAPDEEIRTRAAMALDQLTLNLALNSFRGGFTCTHGRSYVGNILSPEGDAVRPALHLWFGEPDFEAAQGRPNSGAIAAATSGYRVPAVISGIARDRSAEIENHQVHGLAVEEAPEHGFSYDDLDSGMFYWGQGLYTHYKTVDLTARMWREYDLFQNRFFIGLARPGVALSEQGRLDDLFEKLAIASEGAFLADTYTYTYRSPDYILSCALDRRKGEIDSQALVWQAALGGDAVVFTSFPGRLPGFSPDYWSGNGSNPRAAQFKNVLVALYQAPAAVALGELYRYPYSHAWFPRPAFDEVRESGRWVFGRKDDGYVALYSRNPAVWLPGRHPGRELAAPGLSNVWICELGRRQVNGEFEEFIESIVNARVETSGLRVEFESPSQGRVEFDWDGPFRVAGREVPLRRPMRYDNPFVRAPRFAERMEIRRGDQALILDLKAGVRESKP